MSIPHGIPEYLILAGVGAVVSFVNSISGGGSILSLPFLMLLGLPAAEANGTNRIGIWMGTAASVAGFRRRGLFYPGLTWRAAWPGLAGALAGSWAGVSLPDAAFKPVLALVIVFVVFETARPRRQGTHQERPDDGGRTPSLRTGFIPFLVYAGIGFYTGFIQAGVGLIIMYAFSRLGNLNLLQINSLKGSVTLIFITLSILVYGSQGKIHWDMALALALGNGMGGFAGSVLQIRRGEGFVRAFLAVSGGALALKLLYDGFQGVF